MSNATFQRLPYVPGLDGLRAIAVLGVLVYHGAPSLVPGGFLGVEVFFVLSGYLITSLLLAEWRYTGRVDLGRFWLRRVRRLLPALLALLAVTLTITALFLPDQLVRLRAEALAALLYVANWQLIFQHTSYFEAVGRPPLLQHVWSLAIEEQFYLVWPPLLVLGLRFCKRTHLMALALAAAMLSSLLMGLLYQPDADPSRVYFGTDTRAGGLLAGAVLAFIQAPGRAVRALRPWLLNAIGLAALGALVLAGLRLSDSAPLLFRGGFPLVDLATVVLLAAIVDPRAGLVSGLLGRQPLRWMGLRSYGIYLWHWPVFALSRPQLDVPVDGWPLLAGRLAVTFALAELSYRLVEAPVRSGALERGWRDAWQRRRGRIAARWAGAVAVLLLGTAVLGTSVAAARPPERPAYLATEAIDTWQAAPEYVMAQPGPPEPEPEPALEPRPEPQREPDPEPEPTLAPAPTPVATPPVVEKPSVGRITAIGDSIMLGAAGALQETLGPIAIDAAVSRQTQAGIVRLQAHAGDGSLGDVVIVHLGNNGSFTARQFDTLVDTLAGARRVVIVNLKVPRAWEASNNSVLATGVERVPNAVLVDWHSASAGRANFFWDDGMHLRPEGAALYARLVAAAALAP